MRRQIFSAVNLAARRTGSGFNFLLRTFRCNAPPRNNVTCNLSHLIVLVTKRSSVHSTVTFPGARRTHYLLARTPSNMSRTRLGRLFVTSACRPRRRSWAENDLTPVKSAFLTVIGLVPAPLVRFHRLRGICKTNGARIHTL